MTTATTTHSFCRMCESLCGLEVTTDAARGAVLRMPEPGVIEDYATGLPSGFWELTDLSFEPDGTLYLSHTTQGGTGAVFIIPPPIPNYVDKSRAEQPLRQVGNHE